MIITYESLGQTHIFLLLSVPESNWKSTSANAQNIVLCFFYETLFCAVLPSVLTACSKANSLFPISFNRFFNWTLQLQTS